MTKDSKKPKTKQNLAHKKVFDVVPPGKAIAAPNSRSVIIGHKPGIKDDQFVPGGSGTRSATPNPVSSVPASSSSSDVASVVSETASHLAAHRARLTSDPADKRPLMDSHKKVDLKPQSSAETVASAETPQVATAPPLPKTSNEMSAHQSAVSDSALPAQQEASANANAADHTDAHKASSATVPTAPPVPSVSSSQTQPQNSPTTSEHLADLAVEQVVDTDAIGSNRTVDPTADVSEAATPEIASAAGIRDKTTSPGTGAHDATDTPSENALGATSVHPKTVDDLLAETYAPNLEPQQAVVSTHRHHTGFWRVVLIILSVLFASLVALNFLLDAAIIETGLDVPYTDLLK